VGGSWYGGGENKMLKFE